MTSYLIEKDKWPILLAPLLNDITGRVYHRFGADMKSDYDAAKKELESRFHISEAAHRKKLKSISKSLHEGWSMYSQRYDYLQEKWLEPYQTRKEVLQAYGKEAVIDAMPQFLATRVREHNPKSSREAADIAENIVFTRHTEVHL